MQRVELAMRLEMLCIVATDGKILISAEDFKEVQQLDPFDIDLSINYFREMAESGRKDLESAAAEKEIEAARKRRRQLVAIGFAAILFLLTLYGWAGSAGAPQ